MNGDDLVFYLFCWNELKKFLSEIVVENSDDYPEAQDYLAVMDLIERKYTDFDE